jgi:DNA polymerase
MARWFPGESIGRIHGQAKRIGGRVVIPMYHPAAALHRGDLRPVITADFAQLPGLIAAARGESALPTPAEATSDPRADANAGAPVVASRAVPASQVAPTLAAIPDAEGATEQTSLL